jgi:WD40 repeat protein
MSTTVASFYITGGTLQRNASCYVERKADIDLYNGLVQGKFCYVLTSRQMGKSSLMVRTAARLREDGTAVAVLDLTAVGQNISVEQWYNGLRTQMGQRLDLEDELEEYWYENKDVGPLQRWMRMIREVVLRCLRGRVVIFIDEIDAVRSLPFPTDELFAAIRELYNSRTEDAELERLTFCLLGVATPSDLIRDTRLTPFNIGERIELNDFTAEEATRLSRGLMRGDGEARELMKRIVYWTGGHPYLTQRLCREVAEDRDVSSAEGVDEKCEELFLSHRARERDDNLLFVRERMLRSEVDIAGLLELYKRVHKGKRVRDEETSQLVSILRLSGIARVKNGCLRVRNRIYQRVFNQEWVLENMPDAELRRQRAAFRRGLFYAIAISMLIISVILGLAIIALKQRNLAVQEKVNNRRLLYAAQMNLAYQSWDIGNIGRVWELLESGQPKPGEEDLRSFEWYYLWRISHSDPPTLQHQTGIESLAFSPNGKILATGIADGKVKLWDTATRQERSTLNGHKGIVSSVAFSPNGNMLATGSFDGTEKLWDAATGQELATLKGHTNIVRSVAFSPDGKILATGSNDKTVKLWDVATKLERATFKKEHGRAVSFVTFSPDGKILAAAGLGVELWDVATKSALTWLEGHTNGVTSVAFSPDGKRLATVSHDRTVKIWNLATGREMATFTGHTGVIRSVAFSPDGEFLATGGDDSTVKLWSFGSPEKSNSISGVTQDTFKGHLSAVTALTFSPDGKTLATGSSDKTVKLWAVTARQGPATLKGHENTVFFTAFSPDGNIMATGSGDKTVKLWDAATQQELATLKGYMGYGRSVTFSPDGKFLAIGGDDGTVKLWDIATRQELVTLKQHTRGVFSAAFSFDGKILATGSTEVKLLDVATRQEITTLKGHTVGIFTMAFSPNGKVLVTGSFDNTVRLWDVAKQQEFAAIKCNALSMALSPDGKILATGTRDGIIKLLDLATRQEVATLKGHGGSIHSVAFSYDGKRLATGSQDCSIKLWDITTRQELATLKEHTMPVFSVAFSPDGKSLATGGLDWTAKLWRAATEEEVLARSKQ